MINLAIYMRHVYLLFSILFHLSLCGQENENKIIIPYLCDNDKYGIADLTSSTHSNCIFDELTASSIGVTLGKIRGQAVFVKKNGTYSSPISGLTFSTEKKVHQFNQLNAIGRFYFFTENDTTFIYDADLNKYYGPLLKAIKKENKLLAYSFIREGSPSRFVIYTKGENQFVLSRIGATIELPSKNPEAYHIKGDYLYYVSNADRSVIYNINLEEEFVADTIIFETGLFRFNYAEKGGKRFKVWPDKFLDPENNVLTSKLGIEEIPQSLKWEKNGYFYHENEDDKWIEDKTGEVFYSLKDDERVFPFMNNFLLYQGDVKKFLLGDKSSKIRQPHLSFLQIGKNKRKYLFQDSTGYYILNLNGKLNSNDVFENAHKVDNNLLWVEYKNGKKAVLNEDLEVIVNTNEDVVRTFVGNTYIYKVDTLYGLLDSLGRRLTPPLSTQSDFYTTQESEWIKIDQGKKAYIYNIYTKSRTEGLSNEFYFSDKYHDENGENLISSYAYGVDSTYFYRQDGSIYTVLARSEAQHFQKEKHRYTRVETSRDHYVYIDKLHSDTLLTCSDCDGMYLIDLDDKNSNDLVVCSYRNLRQDLYDNRGTHLLPEGVSLLRYPPFGNELKHYPKVIVQQASKIGIYDIVKKDIVIPIIYDDIDRMGENRLSLRRNGMNQITDLKGIPINDESYYRTHLLGNGDIAAQFPMEGTHKKKVYFDKNDPNMDPCQGKIVDAPNFYYKIIDKNGKSRFKKKFIEYKYESDDLINVEEWTGEDTLYYCMNIKGVTRKTTVKGDEYKPFHKDIIERIEGRKYMFVDENLETKVNLEFNKIEYFEIEDEIFYIGKGSTFTYIYNDRFEEKAKVKGSFSISRYGATMLYLYHDDHKDLFLLNIDGTPFTETMLTRAGYYNEHGVMKYNKGAKEVYVDMLNRRKFWD